MGDLIVKKIDVNDIDFYISQEKIVRDNMEKPIWLGDFTKDDYIYLMQNNIMNIYLWFLENNCVGGASLIKIDDETKKEYLSENLDANTMIDFGPIWVNPNYVGNGYQVLFINYLENLIKNKYKYFVTTIDPENIYSIRNFEKCGFINVGEIELKRGKRLVLKKDNK